MFIIAYGTIAIVQQQGGRAATAFPGDNEATRAPVTDREEIRFTCRNRSIQAEEATALQHSRSVALAESVLDFDCGRPASRFHLRASI